MLGELKPKGPKGSRRGRLTKHGEGEADLRRVGCGVENEFPSRPARRYQPAALRPLHALVPDVEEAGHPPQRDDRPALGAALCGDHGARLGVSGEARVAPSRSPTTLGTSRRSLSGLRTGSAGHRRARRRPFSLRKNRRGSSRSRWGGRGGWGKRRRCGGLIRRCCGWCWRQEIATKSSR